MGGRSQAAVFVVDAANGPFTTVQSGLDAAAAREGRDTVIIRPGTYTENVVIDDPGVLNVSGTGAEIVAADDGEATIAILSGDITIRKLSITGGDPGILKEPEADNPEANDNVSLTLNHVDASGNNGRGVNVEAAVSLSVVGGTYNGNDGDGIKAELVDTVSIVGADASGNDSDGLDLEENGSMNLIRLTVNDNGDEGVEVDDCESVFILGCQSNDNADDGLDCDNSAQVVVIHCTSTGNGDFEEENGNGLQVESDDDEFPVNSVLVVNATFSGNSQNGIHVVEDGVVVGLVALTNITAEENQLSRVRLEVSGDVRLSRIASSNNGEADVLPYSSTSSHRQSGDRAGSESRRATRSKPPFGLLQ